MQFFTKIERCTFDFSQQRNIFVAPVELLVTQMNKNYIFRTFFTGLTVIGLLFLLGFMSPVTVAGVRLKQINIFSDIWEREDASIPIAEYSDTTFQAESLEATRDAEKAQAAPAGKVQQWKAEGRAMIPYDASKVRRQPSPLACAMDSTLTRPAAGAIGNPLTSIEDLSSDGRAMEAFYKALDKGHAGRPVRIAVLGDSFIEADIITADLREQMQLIYGGCGGGFVPFSSPLVKYRSSVKENFTGWETYNILKKKTSPASVQDMFCISGNVCVPADGAVTSLSGTTFRSGNERCGVARLLFVNTASSRLDVTINDTIKGQFTPEASPLLQSIELWGDIRSLDVKISAPAGFTGYGVVMEDGRGIGVDNFSVRSNSGMALFATNSALNVQLGKMLGYDLVILQYGLNAMSPDILSYNTYSGQLVRIINYVKECFPGASVMVMSVGDRSTMKTGQYVTMPAVAPMIAAQRKAAEQTGVAFWNTFTAMGGEGGMPSFVSKGWAAKDYTHIGYGGGRYLATEMVRSIVDAYNHRNNANSGSVAARTAYYRTAPPSIGAPAAVHENFEFAGEATIPPPTQVIKIIPVTPPATSRNR